VSPLDAALVRRKRGLIVQNLVDLAALDGLSRDEYAADRMRRKAAERLMQELIEAAVDTNLHTLRILGLSVGTFALVVAGSGATRRFCLCQR
jgi:uncharacterized protein YutE (UPF0331/DUF86 family)